MTALALGGSLIGGGAEGQLFRLRPLDVLVELRYEVFDDMSEGGHGERIFESHSREVAPRVLVQTGAFIIDPRIATLELSLGLRNSGGSFERLDQPEPAQTSDKIASYNALIALLPANRFSLTAGTRRTRDRLQLPFVLASELLLDETSLVFGMRRMAFPGTLSWQTSTVREELASGGLPSLWRDERTLNYRGSRSWGNASLRVGARQFEHTNRLARSVDSRSQDVGVDFDAQGFRPWLETAQSQFFAFRRSGAAASETVGLSGGAGIRLRPNLQAGFSSSLRRDDGLGVHGAQTQLSLGTSLRHQLYRSLRSGLRVSGSRTESASGDSTRQSADAELHYTKRLPWRGQVEARWTEGFERRDIAARAGELRIVGERHTARLGLSFALDLPNVVRGTLVVTSDGGGTVYVEGRDWAVDFFGVRAEIRALVGGAIADGQPVLVSYRVFLPDRLRSRLTKQGGGIDLRFGALGAYYRTLRSEDRALDEVPLQFSGEQQNDEGGLTLSVRAKGLSLQGRVLELRFESPYTAFEQQSQNATLAYSLGGRWSAYAQHERSDTQFQLPVRSQTQELVSVGVGLTPGGRWTLSGRLDSRRFDDSLLGHEVHDSAALNVQWSYGKLAVSGFVGRNDGRRNAVRTQSNRAFVSVLRRF